MSRRARWFAPLVALALFACSSELEEAAPWSPNPRLVAPGRFLPMFAFGDSHLLYVEPVDRSMWVVDAKKPDEPVFLAPLPEGIDELPALPVRHGVVFETEPVNDAFGEVHAWTPKTGAFVLGDQVVPVDISRPEAFMTEDGRWLVVWEAADGDPGLEPPPDWWGMQPVAWDVSVTPPVRRRLGAAVYSEACGAPEIRQLTPGDARIVITGCLLGPGVDPETGEPPQETLTIRLFDPARDFAEQVVLSEAGEFPSTWARGTGDRKHLLAYQPSSGALVRLRLDGTGVADVLGQADTVVISSDGTQVVARAGKALRHWQDGALKPPHEIPAMRLMGVDPSFRFALIATVERKNPRESNPERTWSSYDAVLLDLATGKTEALLSEPTGRSVGGFSPDGTGVWWSDDAQESGLYTTRFRKLSGGTPVTVGTFSAATWFQPSGDLMADVDYIGQTGYGPDSKASVIILREGFDAAPLVLAKNAVRGAMGTARTLFYVLAGEPTEGIYVMDLP